MNIKKITAVPFLNVKNLLPTNYNEGISYTESLNLVIGHVNETTKILNSFVDYVNEEGFPDNLQKLFDENISSVENEILYLKNLVLEYIPKISDIEIALEIVEETANNALTKAIFAYDKIGVILTDVENNTENINTLFSAKLNKSDFDISYNSLLNAINNTTAEINRIRGEIASLKDNDTVLNNKISKNSVDILNLGGRVSILETLGIGGDAGGGGTPVPPNIEVELGLIKASLLVTKRAMERLNSATILFFPYNNSGDFIQNPTEGIAFKIPWEQSTNKKTFSIPNSEGYVAINKLNIDNGYNYPHGIKINYTLNVDFGTAESLIIRGGTGKYKGVAFEHKKMVEGLQSISGTYFYPVVIEDVLIDNNFGIEITTIGGTVKFYKTSRIIIDILPEFTLTDEWVPPEE